MYYRVLADAVSAVHLLLMMFVVLGQLLILVGIVCRWRWIRNPWFRWIHLAAILTVAAEAVLQVNCPLTDWEDDLRVLAQEQPNELSFPARLIHSLLIPNFHQAEVTLPLLGQVYVLDLLYYGFAGLVLLSFWLAPPGRRSPAGRVSVGLACRAADSVCEVTVGRPAKGIC